MERMRERNPFHSFIRCSVPMNSNTLLTQLRQEPQLAFPEDIRDTTRPCERVARIKERLIHNEREIDLERARYTTESYQQTEGEPMPTRRAKMLLAPCAQDEHHN